MDREQTRRGVLAGLLTSGVVGAALSPAQEILARFAPFSGEVWDTARDRLPDEVDSPYGPATLRYDDDGVPHVDADDEQALYFAAGYVQGADRLFQMDLQRRQLRGELSEVVGEATLASDRFHVKMDFAGAAAASWTQVEGTETGQLVRAYTEGVNRHVGTGDLPVEFDLLDYEPDPWTPADVLLAEKQIGWTLTGRFDTLRRATVADALGTDVADTLYPDRLDHDAAILGHEPPGQRAQSDGTDDGASGQSSDGSGDGGTTTATGTGTETATDTSTPTSARSAGIHPDLTDWLTTFESPRGIGSNSWVVSGEHTDSGSPILANDPHLSLRAPPTWYEMALSGPETDVRGVTFPGVPFVVIGENDAGAWGFTNTGTDVIDFYEYETRDGGSEYRHGDQWRTFDTEERTIAVAGGADRDVTVRKTVHGPMLDIETDGDELATEVAVAWTGFGATRTTEAVIELNRSDGLDEALTALRKFDLPTQNCVYADREGNTHYRVVGRVPIRRTDGQQVRGDQVFDGSAREGEWAGYTPYGETDWDGEGFIPFAEMPQADQPGYLGTANQRVLEDMDEYPYYFEQPYAAPYRGFRLWERLDRRVAGDDPVDPAFMQDVQRDIYDKRAEQFVPVMLRTRPALDADSTRLLDHFREWDFRMRTDSRAPLVFALFMDHYADVVFEPRLSEALGDRRDLSEYYGDDWVLLTLPPDSDWFPDGRRAAIVEAMSRTAEEIADNNWLTYGDFNQTTIDHPFDREWLNYPRYETDGSGYTLNNYRKRDGAGSSWRMVCPMDKSGEGSTGAFPGGNDGSVFSDHYADQLQQWADNEYKPIPLDPSGDVVTRFLEGDG